MFFQAGRKKVISRSFLSSTLSNRPPGISRTPDAGGKKPAQQPLVRKAVIGQDCGWDRNDQTMNRVLTEAGIPDLAKSSFGMHSGIGSTGDGAGSRMGMSSNTNTVEALNSDKMSTDFRSDKSCDTAKSERKRAHSTEDENGSVCPPPHKKRLPAANISKKVPLGYGARAGIMLENSRSYVKPRSSDSEEEDENEDVNVSCQQSGLKLFSKEPVNGGEGGGDITEVKKFSWKSKTTDLAASKCDNKSTELSSKTKQGNTLLRNEQNVGVKKNISDDNNLEDILGELGTVASMLNIHNQTDSINNVPSVKLKKKKSSFVGDNERKSLNPEIVDYTRLVDHTENDQVFIILEFFILNRLCKVWLCVSDSTIDNIQFIQTEWSTFLSFRKNNGSAPVYYSTVIWCYW